MYALRIAGGTPIRCAPAANACVVTSMISWLGVELTHFAPTKYGRGANLPLAAFM